MAVEVLGQRTLVHMTRAKIFLTYELQLDYTSLSVSFVSERYVKGLIGSKSLKVKQSFSPFPARWPVGQDNILVLVFAPMRSQLALRPVLFDRKRKMTKLSKCQSNLAKIRMNYSCHGSYRVIYVDFIWFGPVSS